MDGHVPKICTASWPSTHVRYRVLDCGTNGQLNVDQRDGIRYCSRCRLLVRETWSRIGPLFDNGSDSQELEIDRAASARTSWLLDRRLS